MTESSRRTCPAIKLSQQDHILRLLHQVRGKVSLLHLSNLHMFMYFTSVCDVCLVQKAQVYRVYADMMQSRGSLIFREELEDDYLLMESLDLPPASVLPR